jgi:hypothetical protein
VHTLELLADMDGIALEMTASRCGIVASTPRLLSELFAQPASAQRAVRRATEVGAGRLARMLVEFGGHPIPMHANLSVEKGLLCDWFPAAMSGDGCILPLDFAAAAVSVAENERFTATTLLARCSADMVRRLNSALGLPSAGSRCSRIARMVDRIRSTTFDAATVALAKSTAELAPIAANTIESVDVDLADDSCSVTIKLRDGSTMTIAPLDCDPTLSPALPKIAPPIIPQRRVQPMRLPVMLHASSLVTFSTLRGAEEAMSNEAFLALVAQRLDERRVAIKAEVDSKRLQLTLLEAGFTLSDVHLHS